jgi:lambda repressor-like predicted transcriptional regulator
MGHADASTKIPSIAWKLAKTNEQKRKLQYLWAQYPEWAYRYAQEVIGKRWPPGEAAIAGSAAYAYRYALDVIRKPWPPGEAAIAGDDYSAYGYARQIIKKPWPPGEAAIAGSAEWARAYQKEFKVNLHA